MILGAGPRQSMLKHALFTSLAQFGLHWPWRRFGRGRPRRQFDAVRWSPHRVACHQCDRLLVGRVCSGPTSDHWGEAWVRPLVITGFLGGLTTMSAFATGAIGVGNDRPLAENLASALVVVTLCVLAAAMGGRLGR